MLKKLNRNLIVDAGFHKGEDSDFYLKQGYNVVAIDASSSLIADGKTHFKPYFDKGQLTLLNYAISEKSGEKVEFHFGNASQWNSTNKNVTNRLGGFVKSEMVDTISLLDVFKKYGVPYYCKIDLEGMDATAIRSLEPDYLPSYISCESECYGWNETCTPLESLATLDALKELGFNRFKLVEQDHLNELKKKKNLYEKQKPFIEKPLKHIEVIKPASFKIESSARQIYSRKHNYNFPAGSSGPGPIDDDFRNPKNWIDYFQIRDLILFYKKQRMDYIGKNLWMDIHAYISK